MVITASEARSQLFPLIEQVNNDNAPVIITSKKGNAVLISESEWESILETMYLLRTVGNRKHLAKSEADVLAGNWYEYVLPISSASEGKKVSRSSVKAPSTKGSTTAKAKIVKSKPTKKAKAKISAK